MIHRSFFTSFAVWLCLHGSAFPQSDLLDLGMVAETEGRWEDALRDYRIILERNPHRVDLWVRVADIAARTGRAEDAAAALSRAVEAKPHDAGLLFRLSQAYATANNPAAARQAVERALALRPDDPEYVRAAAVLATWTGDYAAAIRRYRQLHVQQPHDSRIDLSVARLHAWSGDTTGAVDGYRRYLAGHPDAADAWLELATAESWRGRSAAALAALRTYRERFGESAAYTVVLARVLAGAGRPSQAVTVLEPLWRRDPGNYDVNHARTIAFALQRRAPNAHDALESIRRIAPTRQETQTAERVVRAVLGSTIEPGFGFYSDSDHLQVIRIAPAGALNLRTGTQLSAGYARHFLRAARDSGLDRRGGGTAVYELGWGELAQAFGGLTVSARVGAAVADESRRTQHLLGARWRASDVFTIGIERGAGFVPISPRTIELGLAERRHRVDLMWSPTLQTAVAAEAAYQALSDGNVRHEIRIAPRHGIVRSSSMNLDLGMSAYRLEARHDLSHGYYDPVRYEAYQAVAYPYFKGGENVGLGFTLSAGTQREYRRPFRFGGSVTAEATLGIYQAWLLRVTASTTHNLRQESGAFQGYAGSVVLTRRF
jgi:tetratricopeptide (TPR) repeat protein